MILCVNFCMWPLGAVEIELEIARCSQAARWKDGKPIFQNRQQIQKSVEYFFIIQQL